MKRLATMLAACALLALQMPVGAEEESAAKKAARQAGSDAKKTGKQAGEAGKKVGKDIGQASTRTANTIKKEFQEDFVERKDNDPRPKKKKVDAQGRK